MTILSMSGWTQPHDALAELAPEAEMLDYSLYGSAERLFESLAHKRYEGVVAWSLGAQLAVRAVQRGVIAPKWMVLLAPPLQFVNDESFKDGMDPLTYGLFREGYEKEPLRSMTRFHGLLVKGDRHFKQILADLTHHERVEDALHWLPWLDDLAAQKGEHFEEGSLPATLLIQGREDVVVPATQAEAWKLLLPEIDVRIIEEMGHTPHLHDPKMVREWIDAHRELHG